MKNIRGGFKIIQSITYIVRTNDNITNRFNNYEQLEKCLKQNLWDYNFSALFKNNITDKESKYIHFNNDVDDLLTLIDMIELYNTDTQILIDYYDEREKVNSKMEIIISFYNLFV